MERLIKDLGAAFSVGALSRVFCALTTVGVASDLEVCEIAKENSSAAQATKRFSWV